MRCRLAVERGKQLWAVAAHIEYRLALEAPGRWAAMMLETGPGRFALGPLPEVAASTHTWEELSPHVHPTPQAAMAAHERVMRGDDLTNDPVAIEVAGGARPSLVAATLGALVRPGRVRARPDGRTVAEAAIAVAAGCGGPGERESLSGGPHRSVVAKPTGWPAALVDLVSTWTEESNGRAEAIGVRGRCPRGYRRARRAAERDRRTRADHGARRDGVGGGQRRRVRPATRRGTGRFAAWLVLVALGDLSAKWPLAPDELGEVLHQVRWYAWGAGEPSTGWALRLAVEGIAGPSKDRAWAVSATDAV